MSLVIVPIPLLTSKRPAAQESSAASLVYVPIPLLTSKRPATP